MTTLSFIGIEDRAPLSPDAKQQSDLFATILDRGSVAIMSFGGGFCSQQRERWPAWVTISNVSLSPAGPAEVVPRVEGDDAVSNAGLPSEASGRNRGEGRSLHARSHHPKPEQGASSC